MPIATPLLIYSHIFRLAFVYHGYILDPAMEGLAASPPLAPPPARNRRATRARCTPHSRRLPAHSLPFCAFGVFRGLFPSLPAELDPT